MDNNPNKVILHCSASKDSKESTYSFEACKRDHLARDFNDIGYHYYITRDGEVHKGRDISTPGAHTKKHNKTSIGVCYEGTYFPTIAQVDALCNLYRNFKSTYGIVDWHGHREYANKECPGFDIELLILIFNKLA